MGKIEERLKELGHTLPQAAVPVANYVPVVHVQEAGLAFTSGHIPFRADGSAATGKLGGGVSVDEGYEAAKLCALNILGSLKTELGELDRITRVVKALALVNSAPDFTQQPAVANGASDLLVEVFGDSGRHARSAVGVAALPLDACIEVELILEVAS
jgi:enamine deaminase RidA (YjgF/YER057c/UK114 family)